MEYFKDSINVIKGYGQRRLDSNDTCIKQRPCDKDPTVVETLGSLKTDIVIRKLHADHQSFSTDFDKDIWKLTGQLLQPF